MLGPVVSADDLSWPLLGWLTVTAVLAFLAWLNLWALERVGRGTDAFRGLIVTSSGATLVLLFSGSAALCLLGVALTVSMAVGRLAAWDRAPVSGLVAGSTVLTALVLGRGHGRALGTPLSSGPRGEDHHLGPIEGPSVRGGQGLPGRASGDRVGVVAGLRPGTEPGGAVPWECQAANAQCHPRD